ncbi:MAG TPA: hypothetical protein VIS26_05490 [Candidatus Limnocylindria bacterium]
MDEPSVERTLAACEQELQAGRTPDLRALGFWRAVAAVKRHAELVDRYATRIATIDRAVFRRRVRLAFPVALGVIVLDLGLFGGLLLLGIAIVVDHPWREIIVLVAAGAIDVTTHGLAHLAVGTLMGIDFTDWFVDLPRRPQPGFKIDYASYLRASPRRRAWMHAAGAIATKLVPFLVIPYAVAIGTETWALLALLVLGVVQIVSDLLYSVKASDWKKFRREMRLAR